MRTRNTGRQAALLLGAATGALIGCGHAVAQTSAPAVSPQIQEVVVTAQRRSENVQSVPISVQAFTAADIRKLGIKSSTDIAQFTPNVEIALPSGAGNQPIITIRGIGLNDYNTNNAGPNGVYLDEVYLSSPSAQTFQAFDLTGVEVLKGPQGTLYGRNTSGGAINLVTAKPTDQFQANAHFEYSSFNTFNLEGAVGGPITANLDGRIAATINESDGYMHNALTGTDENGQNNFALRGALLWKPTEKLKVLLSLHGGYVDNRPTEYRHIGALNPVTGAECSVSQVAAGKCYDAFGYGTPSKFYDGAFNRRGHLRVTDLAGDLRIDYALGSIDLTSLTALDYNKKLHPEDSDASPNKLLEIDYGVRSTTFSQELRAARTTDRYTWVAGAYYLHEDLRQNQTIGLFEDLDTVFGFPGAGDGTAYRAHAVNDQTTDSGALFGQGEYKVTDKFKLILGGRITAERKSFDANANENLQSGGEGHFGPTIPVIDASLSHDDKAFNYRVGVNYTFTPDILTYASIASGFKSTDFNGGFLSPVSADARAQLAPVKPEHVTAYEIGFKSSFFERRLIVDLAAFYNDYQDMQVFVLVPPVPGGDGFPVNILDNAKSAHTEGLDAQVVAKPFRSLTLTAQAGVLKTRLDNFIAARDPSQPDYSGNQLPLAPKVSASLSVDYRHVLGAGTVDVNLNANYKSHVYFDVSNDPYTQQNGYWLENARVAYTLGGGRYEVAAYVHNLSGRKYYVDAFDLANPFGFIEGVVGTPRVFGIELNYRY